MVLGNRRARKKDVTREAANDEQKVAKRITRDKKAEGVRMT